MRACPRQQAPRDGLQVLSWFWPPRALSDGFAACHFILKISYIIGYHIFHDILLHVFL